MSARRIRCIVLLPALLRASLLLAQSEPQHPELQQAPKPMPGHDISQVDVVTPGTAISTPLTDMQEKQLKKYDIPELAGAQQALGSQLIEGRLPRPLIDFRTRDGSLQQRLSIFEGGLVVVRMRGGGGEIRKKLLIPKDALQSYLRNTSTAALAAVEQHQLRRTEPERAGLLRIYSDNGRFVERTFHPASMLPKQLNDQVMPLQDLLRAVSEDRTITSTVAGYEPKPGDELVGDDQLVYRVIRVAEPNGIVELQCTSSPSRLYVAKKELHNYFIGAAKKADAK